MISQHWRNASAPAGCARDLVRIIAAGLRGAGETVSDDDVAAMTVPGGVTAYVRIAADLIAATFGDTATEALP